MTGRHCISYFSCPIDQLDHEIALNPEARVWFVRRPSSINKGLVQRLQSNAAGTLGEHLAGDIDLAIAFGHAHGLSACDRHAIPNLDPIFSHKYYLENT